MQDERSRWSALINEMYEQSGCQYKREYAAKLGIKDDTLTNWLEGGYSDKIDQWIKVSVARGWTLDQLKDHIYGTKPQQDHFQLGEHEAHRFIKSAPLQKLLALMKLCADRLNAPSVVCVDVADNVNIDTSTTDKPMSYRSLASLVKAAFDHAGLTFEQGLQDYLKICPPELRETWKAILTGLMPPRDQDYLVIAVTLSQMTRDNWTEEMVRKRIAPWCTTCIKELSEPPAESMGGGGV